MNPGLEPLLEWYRLHKRDLPWRGISDPYAVWISEAMLQQTTVKAMIPFYLRWMERFPTIQSLADATEAEVLQYWAGLGYYRRARSLHAGAKMLSEAVLPSSAKAWQAIPGIGAYTAGAIASIAQGLPEPLVDGNVERVFARLEANDGAGTALNRAAWQWASDELRSNSPGDWNQALMELGSTICTPLRPRCEICPVAKVCKGLQSGAPEAFPRKRIRPLMEPLNLFVRVNIVGNQVELRQALDREWWAGLWVLPYERTGLDTEGGVALQTLKGVVTKHKITYRPFLLRNSEPRDDATLIGLDEYEGMAIPLAFRKIINLGTAQAFGRTLF